MNDNILNEPNQFFVSFMWPAAVSAIFAIRIFPKTMIFFWICSRRSSETLTRDWLKRRKKVDRRPIKSSHSEWKSYTLDNSFQTVLFNFLNVNYVLFMGWRGNWRCLFLYANQGQGFPNSYSFLSGKWQNEKKKVLHHLSLVCWMHT